MRLTDSSSMRRCADETLPILMTLWRQGLLAHETVTAEDLEVKGESRHVDKPLAVPVARASAQPAREADREATCLAIED